KRICPPGTANSIGCNACAVGRFALGNAAARKQYSRHPAGVIVAGSRSRGACGRISFSHRRARVRSGGAMTKHVLPFLITIATVVLLLLGRAQAGWLDRALRP